MTIKTLLGAAALALSTAAPVAAAPINLDFSFGGFSGKFYGLDNADGSSTAASFDFFGRLDNYTGIDAGGAAANFFEFSAGDLIDVQFSFLTGQFGDDSVGVLTRFLLDLNEGFSSETDLSFQFTTFASGTPAFAQQPVSAVPLPAGALLLLSALAGVAGLKRRKKVAA